MEPQILILLNIKLIKFKALRHLRMPYHRLRRNLLLQIIYLLQITRQIRTRTHLLPPSILIHQLLYILIIHLIQIHPLLRRLYSYLLALLLPLLIIPLQPYLTLTHLNMRHTLSFKIAYHLRPLYQFFPLWNQLILNDFW